MKNNPMIYYVAFSYINEIYIYIYISLVFLLVFFPSILI